MSMDRMDRLELDLQEHGAAIVLVVSGMLTSETMVIEKFREVVREATDRAPGKLILDLAGLIWMDTTGLGELVRLQGRTNECGIELRLAAVNAQPVNRVLDLTQTKRLFAIYQDVSSALANP